MPKNPSTAIHKSFKLTEDDLYRLDAIAKKMFGTAENNRTATIKALIAEKYNEIKK